MKRPDQYLWLDTEIHENWTTAITESGAEYSVKIKRVPAVDYLGSMGTLGFVYILIGAICPFIFADLAAKAWVFFLFIPLGIAAWVSHIFKVDKSLPVGCIPGKTYYKYKVTFL